MIASTARRPSLRLLLGLLLPWPALASAHADDGLLQAVHAFLYDRARPLGEEVVIELHPPSARLPACESPHPFLPQADPAVLGRVSVGVRCGEGGRQVRYLQAEVSVVGEYPTLRRDLPAGTLITAEMLEWRQGDLAALPRRTLFDDAAILGQVTRRPLTAGAPLQAHQLQARALVERGQQVVVEARGAGFRVTREGEALDPGGRGEAVRVRVSRRELVTATVIGEARLAVDF